MKKQIGVIAGSRTPGVAATVSMSEGYESERVGEAVALYAIVDAAEIASLDEMARDDFAAEAMHALLVTGYVKSSEDRPEYLRVVAERAFEIADAMLVARKKR